MFQINNPGCVPDNFDERDYEMDHILGASEPFDWDKGYDIEQELGIRLRPKNQGQSYSCVGQATAILAQVVNAFELRETYGVFFPKYVEEFSAKSIYSQISLGYGVGARMRDGVKLLCDYGVNLEAQVVSYENGEAPSEKFMYDKSWKDDVFASISGNYRGGEYRTLRAKDNIDAFAQALRDSKGMIFGVQGESNGTWRNLMPKIGKMSWAHCIFGGKARKVEGKKYIGFLNSYGETAGKLGWQWFGEEWFDGEHVFNPWFYIDRPNTALIKLLDRNGRPRFVSPSSQKVIKYLINLRGYKFA